ncbi:MAG: hypothetical protein NTX76_05700 [Alphaproteobacteria bacterium]|nr:hypothetical protein [Alphaproteobacteria bacterium]
MLTAALLKHLGAICTQYPETFDIHPKVEKLLKQRLGAFENNQPLDWGNAETLAFATLLAEGHPVRLSGQDSARGTFSNRHAILVDQTNEDRFIPLNHLSSTQAKFDIVESPLSEAAVLGFEYGYSTVAPDTLVLWEAQFGDFANGAQVIIDQFISAAESKWQQTSGLVLLLPHGYEGQGPEHSSARLERFLQLCTDDNWQIVNCSTPANYFHVLRRQVLMTRPKPLIVMTPKSLLRHKSAVSDLKDFGAGTHFQPVISEKIVTNPRAVILCSGKVYYDIHKVIGPDIAIIRLEQFYPFSEQDLMSALLPYKDVKVIWCQEEPMNMGGWSFIEPRLRGMGLSPKYIGRPSAASPATGYAHRHLAEQNQIISQILAL